MQTSKDYRNRLNDLVKKIGHRRITEEADVSSAQLYRYLKGTDLPHDRLSKIVQLGGVTADWLIFGKQPRHLELDETLSALGHVTHTVLSALQVSNEQIVWRPSELQYFLPLFFLNEISCRRYQPDWRLREIDVLKTLEAVRQLRQNMQLEVYVKHLTELYSNPDMILQAIWAGPFCSYVDTVARSYFESQAGKSYYQRVVHNFKPVNIQWVHELVSILETHKLNHRLKLLDFGCGTCRYVRYLNRNHPDWFEVHGIERCENAWVFIREFIKSGELPLNSITREDWFEHSYPDNSMDVVTSYMGLHYFPYVKDSRELGLGRALFEMARTLKKGGIMQLVIRSGLHETYIPYYSRAHNEDEVVEILKKLGLSKVNAKPLLYQIPSKTSHEVPIGFDETQTLFFHKT